MIQLNRLIGIIALIFLVCISYTSAQDEAIPEPMPLVDKQGYDIVNFLLLGSDTTNPQNAGRTDVIMIVSVNRTAGTVALLSIPRDLYVYIPGYEMYRINSAYGFGEQQAEGGGIQLLKEVIRYNLGFEIDYYARVDFNGFKNVVDSIGGVDISVDCAIQDWRLREPELDPTLEENWEQFTLPVGVHHMNGDLALWYVRSRRTSSDFDRGRRQQDMMRALWRQVRDMGLIDQIPDIWGQVTEIVKTDVTLGHILSLAPMALSIDTSRIASYTFRQDIDVQTWLTPEGSSVQVPVREQVLALGRKMMQPPTDSQLVREHASIEIMNASGVADLSRVAADRLAVEGFVPIISTESVPGRQYTVIYDYTGRTKGSSLDELQAVLRVHDEGVFREPNPDREYDFRVVIGSSYYSCTHNVMPPTDTVAEAD
jgi:polyisoprenyl-teichoic acid--peptidoglycan teichoic acid transferase